MKLFNNALHKGFTLIELLIVVVILGVLAAVAIPQFTASTNDAQEAALDSTLATTRTAIDLYFQEHGEYPGRLETAVGAGNANTQAAFLDQLTMFTDGNGITSNTNPGGTLFGPYMKKDLPADPINNVSVVEVVTTGSLNLTATAGNPSGWKYDSVTGGIIMNHATYQTR